MYSPRLVTTRQSHQSERANSWITECEEFILPDWSPPEGRLNPSWFKLVELGHGPMEVGLPFLGGLLYSPWHFQKAPNVVKAAHLKITSGKRKDKVVEMKEKWTGMDCKCWSDDLAQWFSQKKGSIENVFFWKCGSPQLPQCRHSPRTSPTPLRSARLPGQIIHNWFI